MPGAGGWLPGNYKSQEKEAIIPRQITTAHRKAMEDGRAKAAKERRREIVKRVVAFRKWLELDAEYSRQFRDWLQFEIPMKMKSKPPPPAGGIPSDNDYKVAREEGAIT